MSTTFRIVPCSTRQEATHYVVRMAYRNGPTAQSRVFTDYHVARRVALEWSREFSPDIFGPVSIQYMRETL
jgi:hypothetical protein